MNYRSQPYTFNRIVEGNDAITYYIDSSLGDNFLESQNTDTILTAYIYKGSVELDQNGEFDYSWFLVTQEGEESYLGTNKSITVSTQTLGGNSVYFEAKSHVATLGSSILGYVVIG